MSESPTRTKSPAKYRVSPEEFIEAWITSRTVTEVAKKLGMPEPIIMARASFYRKKGVNIKLMLKRGRQKLDVDYLNKMIDRMSRRDLNA